jgi:hypothetical protein
MHGYDLHVWQIPQGEIIKLQYVFVIYTIRKNLYICPYKKELNMKLKSLFLLISLLPVLSVIPGFSLLSAQTPVQITVDAGGVRKPVSPFIYGKNNSLSDNGASPVSASQWQLLRDAGIMMFRESGGNNSTKYNWRKKLTSHPDWYNNVYSHDWDYAANSLQKNIPSAAGMWTLPLIGKAASNKSNNFNDWSYNSSQWWSGVNQNLAGGGTVNSAGGSKALKEGDPALYLQNWPADSAVGILNKWFGTNGLGYNKSNLTYWNMDNEPEIWNGTHDDVMPVQISAEEFMQRYFETAKKARAIFPEIKLVGPVPANEWQWYNWNSGAISYGGKNYVWLEYFIKRIADEQKATGIRLLDVLDIHFYPGESAAADIVQLHRVYFDRTYVYPGNNGVHRIGGWDTSITKEYIFGRCQDWLNQYMGTGHGVTFSVTETDVNTSDPNVRAIWYASTLGEFAKQGVEIFTPWSWAAGMYEVVHLFSKYNQEYYLNATSSEELNVSAYPTVNTQADSLTIVLINRSQNTTKETQVAVNNFTLAEGPVTFYRLSSLGTTETFKSHTVNALKTGSITPAGNMLAVSLPPLSVTSLLVKGRSLGSGDVAISNRNDLSISAFPNPADKEIIVSWPSGISGISRIEVFNSLGQLVNLNDHTPLTIDRNQIILDSKNWKSGIYFICLQTKNACISTKIKVLH